MKNGKIIIVAVVVLALIGVGAYFLFFNKPATNNSNTSSNDVIANAPTGCPNRTTVVVKSDEAGTQNITSANSNFIHWRKDQALLVFTNYTLNTDSIYSDITGDRVLAVVKISNQDGSTIAAGTYRKKAETGTATPNLYTPEYNISTVDLAGGVFDNNATVKIDYLGTDYVCGTVTSDDGSSSISGQFIAKYVDNQ